MTAEKLNGIIDKCDTLLEGCEGLPQYIRKRVRAKYINDNVPLIMNHVTEIENPEYVTKNRTLSPTTSLGDTPEIVGHTALEKVS